jgi:hypothetical protein
MSKFDEMRVRLTEEARAVLSAIWAYRQERDAWIPTPALFNQLGRDYVLTAFNSLNGSIVNEQSGNGDLRCALTFLGILLTDNGEESVRLLERLLGYVQDRLRSDPEFNKVDSQEVKDALNLTESQFGTLSYIYWESQFTGGGGGHKEKWSFGIPYYVKNELPLEENLTAYIESYVLKAYDTHLPVLREERERYLAGANGSTTRSEFWFVADSGLRKLLESDWREAQSVYHAGAWKSCVLLCGSILEGVLMDALSRDTVKANREYSRLRGRSAPTLDRWDLADLVETANELKIFPRGTVHLGHAVREFRNLVHPGRQLREHIQVTEDQSNIAISLVKMCLQR